MIRRMYDAFHSGDASAALEFFAADVSVDTTGRPDGEVGMGREALRVEVGRISSMSLHPGVPEALEAVAPAE